MVNEIAENYESLIAAQLIGVDWGSTGLRVFLLGHDAKILATRTKKEGASVLKGAREFSHSLHMLAGDWVQFRGTTGASIPIIACGMVGSQHGWKEAAYLECPASIDVLAQTLTLVDEGTLHICPGLRTASYDSNPDVMRGEETQIFGALQLHPEFSDNACIILPGTHSKWAQVKSGKVSNFATYMTGEMFAVLTEHSVLGRLIPKKEDKPILDRTAFLLGVEDARQNVHLGLTHQLFAARTLALTGRMRHHAIEDYLSGLLIGHEIVSGLNWTRANHLDSPSFVMIGDPNLCDLYAQAFAQFSLPLAMCLDNTAPIGLWHIAKKAGLNLCQPPTSNSERTPA